MPVVTLHARVVARRDIVGVERAGALGQRRELQVPVAVDTGNRRPATDVLAHEVRDHLIVELALEIDDVVGNADARRYPPGVVQVVDRATGAEADLSLALVIQLHREADHLVPLPREKRSSHRGIDAAGHGHYYSHLAMLSAEC